MKICKYHNGFSRIEIIVVVSICVFLIGCAFVVGTYFSKKTTDIQVLSDIAQIQSALDINYAVNTYYPLRSEWVSLGQQRFSTEQLCLRNFTELIASCEKVILSPLPQHSSTSYTYISLQEGAEYRIQFELSTNHPTLGLTKGYSCAFPGGMQAGPCIIE